MDEISKEELFEDYKALLADYWYVIQCWNHKSITFPSEIKQREDYFHAAQEKYDIY
jgi:hypothetical protein